MKTKLLLLLMFFSLLTTAQTNLVPNGDFENWSSGSQPDSWYRYFNGEASQSAIAQSGSSSVKMQILDGTINFINTGYFPVVANKTYRITAYHRLVSGTFTSLDFRLYHKPSVFKEKIAEKKDVAFSNNQWTKIEFEYTTTVSENVEVDIWTNGDLNSEILIDNVSVVDISGGSVQYTMIPDAKFEAKLIALGLDDIADGKVLTSKISGITDLNVNQSSISDLTGIEGFTNLKILSCTNNNITSLDFTNNLLLENINCSDNKISSLNITKNINLVNLNCGDNALTALDVSANTLLRGLYCYKNKIEILDLSKNVALAYVNCSENYLEDLDLSNHPKLFELYCFSNSLKTLDVSKSVLLNYLLCDRNWGLTTLDLTNNVNLVELNCSVNKLKSLDLTNNTLLTTINCGSNVLETLSLPNTNTVKDIICDQNKLSVLDVSSYVNLKKLGAGFNMLTSLDVTANTLLTYLSCQNNKITKLDISQNKVLTAFYCHSNLLTELNLKNGSNTLITNVNMYLDNNPNLTCIQVDDENYSNTTWLKKDATALFSTNCNLGIEDSKFNKAVVYPNPTKGELNITNIALEKATVYNSTGQEVKSFTLDSANTNNSISLTGLPKGIYYVYFINEDAASAQKIILE